MDRRVANFPILKLWHGDIDLPVRRLRDILREEVDGIVFAGPIQIIVAQAGAPLLWMMPENARSFWKRTPKSAYFHTISFHGQKPDYSVSPGYLFFPSIWESLDGIPVVLLESICWPADVYGAASS